MNRVPCLFAGLLLADVAVASDMTVLMFVVSMPACLVLVGISFVMANLLRPSWNAALIVPISALAAIHIYMLPEMYHREEQVLFAIQVVISLTALLAFRQMRRRATSAAQTTLDD